MLDNSVKMAFDFTGKKILVTGAGRGIGRSFTLEIAAAGATVYALGRTKETLDSLVEESDRIHPIVADISDWDKTRPLLDELEVMDGVVNNAAETPAYKGIQAALEFPKEELELFQWENVLGTINVIQSTGKKMVAAGNGGSIVNISRYANEMVLLGMQIYSPGHYTKQRPNTKLPHTLRATINKESTTTAIPS